MRSLQHQPIYSHLRSTQGLLSHSSWSHNKGSWLDEIATQVAAGLKVNQWSPQPHCPVIVCLKILHVGHMQIRSTKCGVNQKVISRFVGGSFTTSWKYGYR